MAPQEQDMRYPPSAKSAEEKTTAKKTDEAASAGANSPDEAPEKAADKPPQETPSSTPAATSDLLSEILSSVYRAEGMTAQGFAALRARLEAIEQRLGMAPEDPAPSRTSSLASEEENAAGDSSGKAAPASETTAKEAKEPMPPDDVAEAEAVPELPPSSASMPIAQPIAKTDAPGEPPPTAQPQQMPRPAHPVRDVHPVAAPGGGSELEAIVFGQDLAYHESLLPERRTLLAAVHQGDEDALGLVGQLLIVRSATMDRLPGLLKYVGEAWYRWRGEETGAADPLRDAVIVWLHSRLEAVGLGNRIELVRLGDRYDSKRHNAKARGVEVTGVHGWVVLRDNGKVYTKANVTVA